jgi:hypothetical protein
MLMTAKIINGPGERHGLKGNSRGQDAVLFMTRLGGGSQGDSSLGLGKVGARLARLNTLFEAYEVPLLHSYGGFTRAANTEGGEIEDAREIVFRGYPPRAADAGPPGPGGGPPAVPPASACRGAPAIVRAGLRHYGGTPRWRRVYASPGAEYPSHPGAPGDTRALGRVLARRAPPAPDHPSPLLTHTVWAATLRAVFLDTGGVFAELPDPRVSREGAC